MNDPIDELVEAIAAELHPHFFSGDTTIRTLQQEKFKDRAADLIRSHAQASCEAAVVEALTPSDERVWELLRERLNADG